MELGYLVLLNWKVVVGEPHSMRAEDASRDREESHKGGMRGGEAVKYKK